MEIVMRTTAPLTAGARAGADRASEILELQELVPRVPAAQHVVRHAVALARASRPDERGRAGSSCGSTSRSAPGPRASQALVLGAKARAVLRGRYAAEIEDVRALLARPVLRHRLVSNFRAEAEGDARGRSDRSRARARPGDGGVAPRLTRAHASAR